MRNKEKIWVNLQIIMYTRQQWKGMSVLAACYPVSTGCLSSIFDSMRKLNVSIPHLGYQLKNHVTVKLSCLTTLCIISNTSQSNMTSGVPQTVGGPLTGLCNPPKKFGSWVVFSLINSGGGDSPVWDIQKRVWNRVVSLGVGILIWSGTKF